MQAELPPRVTQQRAKKRWQISRRGGSPVSLLSVLACSAAILPCVKRIRTSGEDRRPKPRKIQSISMQWIGRFGACLPTNFHHKTAGFLAKARWFCVRSETRKFSFRARLSINRSHFMGKLSIGVFAIAVLAASINVAAAQRVEPTPMEGGGPGALPYHGEGPF